MNQNRKYTRDKYYDALAGNLRTVNGDTVEIDHQIIVSDLPDDISNSDLVSADNLGRLYRLPKSSFAPGNPFDQDLNTTNQVQFDEVTVSDPNPPVTIGYDTFKFIKPELFTPGNWGARQSFYLSNIGVLESTLPHFGFALSARNDQNISFSQYFTQESPFGWKHSQSNQDAFRIHYQDYNQFDVSRGLNFYANATQGNVGTVVDEEIVMSIQSGLYGLGLHIAPINSNSALYIDNITSNNANTRILTLNSIDNKVQETELTDINLNDLQLGLTTTTTANTTSQLRIIRPSVVGNTPSTDGSAFGMYIDTNIYPKLEMYVKNTNESSLGFGVYHNSNPGFSGNEYLAGSNNFFRFSKEFDELKLYKSSGVQSPGNPVSSKEIVRFRDGEMRFIDGYKLQTDFIEPLSGNITSIGSSDFTNDVYMSGLNSSTINTTFLSINAGVVQEQSKEFIFGQDLTTSSNVSFNRVTVNDFIETDIILENTVNNGVSVGSWNLKPQKIISDALVNVNNPLRIDLNLFGDSDSVVSVNGYDHDNNGIMFDMKKDSSGGVDDMISSSVNANIFINKQLGALKFLVTNAITKGGAFLKSTMNNVMEIGKTYVNINEVCTFDEAVLMTNIPTSTTNTTYLTKHPITNEIQQQELLPAKYDYSFFENNIVATTINVINVYERIVYAAPTQTGDGLFTIANNGGLEYTYIGTGGKIGINIDYNVYKSGGGNELYQFELRLNGVKIGPSPHQKLEDNTKWQMLSVNGTLPLTTNDVFTFWVRCETGTDNITVSQFTFNAFEIK